MNICLKNLVICVLLGGSQLVTAQTLHECANSMMLVQGNFLFVRASLPIKPAGDAKREWSKLSVTGACQALGVSEVLMHLQDGKINGLQMVFAPGTDKLLHLLEPAVQLAVSAQLTRDANSAAQHPLSIFKGDRAGFNYKVIYQKNVFSETIAWGTTTWGAHDER